ncbi:MAG TPA: Sir2 family NAD-dependent protein deacetylase [Bacteroidales bacterium]|jgi:NAD-dependent deacetylase|nr:Sir2 family NAD-dependent protein deacetylase [Bacteroidales bacterium]
MKKLVVLTGSGISSESGLKTFRDSGGLWENYDVMEVASYAGWIKNMELVLQFYNERRAQLEKAVPNHAHKVLVELEEYFDVKIITQNVDNLHEKAGSQNVLHLHGILTRARSTGDPELIYEIGYKPIGPGDKCEKGFQLRPDIVWFGEAVPAIEKAAVITSDADIFVVIGTSMVVYPAAGLIDYVPKNAPVFLIDPNDVAVPIYRHIHFIREKAGAGVEQLKKVLIEKHMN